MITFKLFHSVYVRVLDRLEAMMCATLGASGMLLLVQLIDTTFLASSWDTGHLYVGEAPRVFSYVFSSVSDCFHSFFPFRQIFGGFFHLLQMRLPLSYRQYRASFSVESKSSTSTLVLKTPSSQSPTKDNAYDLSVLRKAWSEGTAVNSKNPYLRLLSSSSGSRQTLLYLSEEGCERFHRFFSFLLNNLDSFTKS